MAKYADLSKTKEQTLLGRTWRMYKCGFTPVDISLALEQPIERINYWIGLCKNVDKMRKRIQEEING